MGRRPLSEWIAEQDRFARLKHKHFRRGAEVVAAAFARLPEVGAVYLFGSVARPLETRLSGDETPLS